MKKSLLLALLTCSACHSYNPSTATDPYGNKFQAFSGEQQWATNASTFYRLHRGFPVYYELPDRPYRVLGRVTHDSMDLDEFIRCAMAHHADAVLISSLEREHVGTKYEGSGFGAYGFSAGSAKSEEITRDNVTFYVIKFIERQ